MQALDLILLGRHLTKLGERALRGRSSSGTPSGRALVLRDVFAHPGSPVADITARTGLPQSYVSESVAGLRDEGILETAVDAHDRRRTLVSVSRAHRRRVAQRAAAEVDATLAQALGEDQAGLVLPLLERLAELLPLDQPGPIATALRSAGPAGEPAEAE